MNVAPALDLLAGPRGRRLCWVAVVEQAFRRRQRREHWELGWDNDLRRVVIALNRTIDETDFDELARFGDVDMLELFADSVDEARYWQDPDEVDALLTNPRVVEALGSVAEVLGRNPATRWFIEDVALEDQVYIDWCAKGSPPPTMRGASTILKRWKQNSGHLGRWWSPPIWAPALDEASRMDKPLAMLARTTQSRPMLGAVGLLLEEDNNGTPAATCRPVRPTTRPRVFEIAGPDAWRELVERYPLEVTKGHAGSWGPASGLSVRWLLPDWARVAEEFDVIHLPAARYLELSGVAIRLDESVATFIAGWNPDESFWLNDLLGLVGHPVHWEALNSNPRRGWRAAVDG